MHIQSVENVETDFFPFKFTKKISAIVCEEMTVHMSTPPLSSLQYLGTLKTMKVKFIFNLNLFFLFIQDKILNFIFNQNNMLWFNFSQSVHGSSTTRWVK